MRPIKILLLMSIFLLSSCSTLRKTVIYSTAGGTLAGGFLGKASSPNSKSDPYNIGLGALTGGLITGLLGYYFYKSNNPQLELKDSPIKQKNKVKKEKFMTAPISQRESTNTHSLMYTPKLIPVGAKKYFSPPTGLTKEEREVWLRQYTRRYRTEPIIIEMNGKKYKIPSYEIIETGMD